ncbi:MAG TPA: hypothetical protein DIT35_08715, partial [Rhodospirillaceae bacterium]|nr:hypothetical protein [Rhodospirillaceae bacterium]
MTDPVAVLADFPQRLRMASWFSFVGTPLSESEREDVAEYMQGIGLNDLSLVELETWRAAEDRIKQTDWDASWWKGEEDLRKTLLEQATAKIGDTALTRAL